MARSKKKRTTRAAGQKNTASKKHTICLAMIVKNEEKDIERCLNSVKDHIDHWVIFDTGSSDKTMDIIQSFMDSHKIPGELHESEWKDFSTNRNEVLRVADTLADFTLCMDADDYLKTKGKIHDMIGNGHHVYHATFTMNNTMSFDRPFLFKNKCGIRYKGVLHEVLVVPESFEAKHAKLSAVVIHANSSPTKRADTAQEKYKNDAEVLLKEHKKNPDDARTLFYLAQSYRDAGMYDESIEYYKKRIELGGWDEEVYMSKLMVATNHAKKGSRDELVADLFLEAWEFRPCRLEGIHSAVTYYRNKKRYRTAYALSAAAMGYYSQFGGRDKLFVASDIENWRMMDEYCINAFYSGEYQVAYVNTKILMDSSQWSTVPEKEQERIKKNMKDYEKYYIEQNKES